MSYSAELSKWTPACRGGERGARYVHGQAEFPLKNPGTGDVVAMVVRDYESVNLADISAGVGEPLLGTLAAYAGVEEQFCSAGFYVYAITVAARL